MRTPYKIGPLLDELQVLAQEQRHRQRVLSLIQPPLSQSFPQRIDEAAEESNIRKQHVSAER